MNTAPFSPGGHCPATAAGQDPPRPQGHPVGILGGMGPAAGVDFVRLFLEACERHLRAAGAPIVDQAFPEHWLVQVPVVDRSRALLERDAPQPLEGMERAIAQLAAVGAQTIAIACNTAHAWHAALQRGRGGVELLHIAKETAAHLRAGGVDAAVLLATQGTYRMGLYQDAFDESGIQCVLPRPEERQALMEGIYEGVKAGRPDIARERFGAVASALHRRHGALPLVMACTEIPLALPFVEEARAWTLVDPADVLARALAQRAYGLDG
ncbi:Aspartate racemase [Paraburkholderia caffeinitolerans]|uniref:Aspartate racemase n=1 Tax=Paraburkholderia caffeinitolerans TaxID=1723730 RepID=A0A6J5GI94_9BURK|nr:amino acid racemase [Paraburkholderia caffeinitolerans]CAB3799888.1 Aspartate racemase [Paraburkholderia caffeinitolerans]